MAKPLTILVAEDDSDDVFFLKRAVEQAGITDAIQIVSDGQEAVDYLEGVGNYADQIKFPPPWLVLLDIKMPRKTGLETLQWMRSQGRWAEIPVMLLSTSSHVNDVERAHQLKASAYVTKPESITALANELKKFYQFWRPSASRTAAAEE